MCFLKWQIGSRLVNCDFIYPWVTGTRKKAYGVEMLEIYFNEQKLINLMGDHRLDLIDEETIEVFPFWKGDKSFSIKSFLCKKIYE